MTQAHCWYPVGWIMQGDMLVHSSPAAAGRSSALFCLVIRSRSHLASHQIELLLWYIYEFFFNYQIMNILSQLLHSLFLTSQINHTACLNNATHDSFNTFNINRHSTLPCICTMVCNGGRLLHNHMVGTSLCAATNSQCQLPESLCSHKQSIHAWLLK